MSEPFYRTQAWRRLRAACLKRDPVCMVAGCTRRSVVADHITPRSKGGADSLSNLRGLCIQHHNMRRQGNEPWLKGCDASGKPNDPTHWWNSK
ncbi:HNH endonuclease [Acetobacter senegalensis]|uniref:HNH endonuclease n=1 Tax=Acetobacter senegalensis TaxID=446692 RepID=UPI001ED9F3F7|nr:HNH endonuclease signature motif containing protein [Acetobacter senegalensis]MCG4260413.1 HNH endonuclease [Acetobacter senegalensis]